VDEKSRGIAKENNKRTFVLQQGAFRRTPRAFSAQGPQPQP
jgi:hypothetical protein